MANQGIKDDWSPQHTWLGTDARVVRHVHVFGRGQLAIATRVELARLGIHRDTDYHLQSLLPPLVIACSDFDGDDSFKDPARRVLDERPPVLFACLGLRTVRIGPLIEPRSACIVRRPGRSAGTEPSWTRTYAAGLPVDAETTSGMPRKGAETAAGPAYPVDSARANSAGGSGGTGGSARRGGATGTRSTSSTSSPSADIYPGAGSTRYAQGTPSLGVAESDPNRSFFARVGAVLIAGQALNFLLGARNQCVLGRVVEFDPFAFESKTYRVLKVTQ